MSETTKFEFDENENVFEEESEEESYALPHTITLEAPVQVGKDTTMTELVFQKRPNAGMMLALPVMKMTELQLGHFIPIIAGMTCQPQQHIKKIEFKDLQKCLKVASFFLKDSGAIS